MKDQQLQKSRSPEELSEVVAALEARVAALEKQLGIAGEKPAASPPVVQAEAVAGEVSAIPHAGPHGAPYISPQVSPQIGPHAAPQLPSLGGAMLMLAGAFLLRALTEAGLLNATLGVALGLAYMLILLGLTRRAAAGG